MTLRERQDQFIEAIDMFDTWQDKFNFLIDYSNLIDATVPEGLLKCRIENCTSQTYFRAKNRNGKIRVAGWSNSAIVGGIIISFQKIFDDVPVTELRGTEIDFHTKSGLINNLTTMRQLAVMEMISRICVLSKS
jgi:cysteine desulfuration protein SufE